jgi:hypothetical protein
MSIGLPSTDSWLRDDAGYALSSLTRQELNV